MRTWFARVASRGCGFQQTASKILAVWSCILISASVAWAQPEGEAGGEASLRLPDLAGVKFLGIDGHSLLMIGILFCIFGLGFGLTIYTRLKNLPVHRAMRDISELIYETCKTYVITQGKFLLLLWVFVAVTIVLYFGVLAPVPNKPISVTLPIILLFSIIGMAGSYGVAWFGIRVNTFTSSGISAPASVPQEMIEASFHHWLGSPPSSGMME